MCLGSEQSIVPSSTHVHAVEATALQLMTGGLILEEDIPRIVEVARNRGSRRYVRIDLLIS